MREQCAVPFTPTIKPGQDAAGFLTAAMAQWRSEGWGFSHLENVFTVVNNGCLAGVFGKGQSVMTVQVAILIRLPAEDSSPESLSQ